MSKVLKRLLAAVTLAFFTAGVVSAQTVEVEGVKLDSTAQIGPAKLVLNGAGVRVKVFFKVYVAGLYVPQKATDSATLLAQKGPRRISITMLRNVDADSFSASLNDGLRDNHSETQFASLKPQLDALTGILKSVGEAKKGDVIHFEYLPESGTRVTVNATPRGAPIPGEEFFTSVLRIWLGDKPADSGLKKAMIGV